MFEVFWFYFLLQVRAVAKASVFAVALCGTIAAVNPFIAYLGMMMMFSMSWPKTVLAPLINFHWMATLPVSRVELIFSRAGVLVSGVALNMIAVIFCSMIVSFQAVKSHPSLVKALAKQSAAPTPESVRDPIAEASFAVFGGQKIYALTLVLVVGVLALLWMTVASRAVHSPGRGVQLSGNPWWHPDWPRKLFSWGVAAGLPLVLLGTAKLGMRPYVGTFNFLLVIGWLSYTLGSLIVMSAKIPRDGARQWLFWLTASNYVLAGMVIAVSWSWSVMHQALDAMKL